MSAMHRNKVELKRDVLPTNSGPFRSVLIKSFAVPKSMTTTWFCSFNKTLRNEECGQNIKDATMGDENRSISSTFHHPTKLKMERTFLALSRGVRYHARDNVRRLISTASSNA